jgi:hypothetical protein
MEPRLAAQDAEHGTLGGVNRKNEQQGSEESHDDTRCKSEHKPSGGTHGETLLAVAEKPNQEVQDDKRPDDRRDHHESDLQGGVPHGAASLLPSFRQALLGGLGDLGLGIAVKGMGRPLRRQTMAQRTDVVSEPPGRAE